MYAQRLKKEFQEVQSGHMPVLGLVYCCYAAPYDLMPYLSFSKIRRSIDKIENKNRVDGGGPFFFGGHNRQFYEVPKIDCSCLYATDSIW